MRWRSSIRRGAHEVASAQQHGAEDAGLGEVTGDLLGPAGQLERLVDVDEQPVRGEVDEESGALGRRLVTERVEGGLGDAPAVGIGSRNPTAPNCGIGEGRIDERRGVAGLSRSSRPRRAAGAGPRGRPGGAGRHRCGR